MTVTVPFGVWSVNDSTWLAKLPSTWWLLPCTSAAIAPPTVTSRVPGVTCTNQPSGTIVRMIASRLTPASTRTTPALDVDLVEARERGGVEHDAAGVLRRVAVAAAEPARDQAAPPGPREPAVDVGRRRARSTTVAAVGAVRLHPVRSSVRSVTVARPAQPRTPSANVTSQITPTICSTRSESTTSSGAPPPPWSTTSA